MRRALVCGIALSAALSACAGAGAGATVTLTVFGDPAEIASFQRLIDEFHALEPEIRVSLDAVGKDADQVARIATAFAGGRPPDLFLMNFRRFGQFAARGVLEPLGPRAQASAALDLDGFYEQSLDAFRYDGELLCLPQNISSQVVYYNTRLFADARLAPPDPEWTWDDFLATAQTLTRDTDGDGRIDVYGLGIDPTLVRLAPFIWQGGAEVVDDMENPTRMPLLDQRALEILRWFIGLRRDHRVTPEIHEVMAEKLDNRFAGGRLGMLVESRRLVPTLREVPGLEWDVAPLPRNVEAATMLHSDAYCMAGSSERKDEAFRFLEFAFSPEGASIIARTGRTVPSIRAVAESDAYLAPGEQPANARVWLDQIPIIRRTPVLGTWNEIEERVDVIIEEWFYGPEPIEALGIEIDFATRPLFAQPDIS